MIELRVGHVDAHLRGERRVEASRTVVLRKYLDNAIGRIGAIQCGCRPTRHILNMVDVLHGDVAHRARCRCLSVDVAIGIVHHIEERRTRIEVIDPHAIHIDDGGGIGKGRGNTTRFDDGGGARLAGGKRDLHVRHRILQHLVDAVGRKEFQVIGREFGDIRGEPSFRYGASLSGHHHLIETFLPHKLRVDRVFGVLRPLIVGLRSH